MQNLQNNKLAGHKISVIVPVYNEIDIIPSFHAQLIKSLDKLKFNSEIIYIDDNSTDGTYEWLSREAKGLDINVYKKTGQKGKAFSLVEGFDKAAGDYLVMIDADLQYPPQAIPGMVRKLAEADVVVANRQFYTVSKFRKFFSKSFRRLFGHTIFGLECDIQSGLKAFKREVYRTIKFEAVSPWTFDLEFLYRARFAGYKIISMPIVFSGRTKGQSKINLTSGLEIMKNALELRLKRLAPAPILPLTGDSMRGAGSRHNHNAYITHTTMPLKDSALKTVTDAQALLIIALVVFVAAAFFNYPLEVFRTIATILSVLYLLDSLFNLYLVNKSMARPRISTPVYRLKELTSVELPVYSILCPLYKEAGILPQFLDSINRLDWPKNKLDVLLLLEEDDYDTIQAVNDMKLPLYVRAIIVPHSLPKTKPKACNYGLTLARGEYLVIYDAEDIPDPLQLKKAYLAFQSLPPDVRCVQAKLNFYNSGQNLITRLFTAEYSLWFDLTLTGLQSAGSIIPLGGTSNHFRTTDLLELYGWDPFNVTEDADLGVRLFRKGYKTAIIDSTTLEEASSGLHNWLRQRSRWIKGYFQTYLVHTRNFGSFVRQNGLKQSLYFHLTFGGKLLFLSINPFMWATMLLFFSSYVYFGPVIELIYYPPMSYVAVAACIFGNFFFLYSYMIACARREQWSLLKYVYLMPLYWAMMSYATAIAFAQLIFKPHYWEKTNHGFHLDSVKQPTLITPARKPAVWRPAFAYNVSWASALKFTLPEMPQFLNIRRPSPAFLFKKSTKGGRASSLRPLSTGLSRFITIFYYIMFVTLDILVVNLFYPHDFARNYLYLSLTGKILYLLSQLVGFSVLRAVTGKAKNMLEKKQVSILVFSTFLASWIGVVFFSFGQDALPGFLVSKFGLVSYALPAFMVAMMCYAMASALLIFNLRNRSFVFLPISYLALILQTVLIWSSPADFAALSRSIVLLAGAYTLLIFTLQFNSKYIRIIEDIFTRNSNSSTKKSSRGFTREDPARILIFNWRDTGHVYAGGAEVYVREIARHLISEGKSVTLFCANDGREKANETIDGLNVIRRGGTYTVYLYAFFYYLFKFAGKYDLIIDCENGIPFFTPLYVRKPVVLVIHHIHQEIVRKYLHFPLNHIAAFLEGKLMPLAYRNKKVVTVSRSSRDEIIKLGFTKEDNIEIIPNGINIQGGLLKNKTANPSFVYLGRLQDYKNIDTAIIAFSRVASTVKDATLKIVGSGESMAKLKKLASFLGVEDKVKFLGKVSENKKIELLGESWVALQPSSIEGWGITVIEANACGTPVIASRVNGLRDSVLDNRTGILVEHGNIEEFARAMELLAADRQLRLRLSREAYAWSENFKWDESARHFSALIEDSLPAGFAPARPAYAPSGNIGE